MNLVNDPCHPSLPIQLNCRIANLEQTPLLNYLVDNRYKGNQKMISHAIGLRRMPIRNIHAMGYSAARYMSTKKGNRKDDGSMYIVRAGLPLILFCGLGVWVVANGIEGKNKERDLFQGRISK